MALCHRTLRLLKYYFSLNEEREGLKNVHSALQIISPSLSTSHEQEVEPRLVPHYSLLGKELVELQDNVTKVGFDSNEPLRE